MKLIKRLFSWVFGKQLATVGIVTEELRLIERLFQPLREYAEGA